MQKEQDTKMRIKLYNPDNGLLVEDRLVEQSTELTIGPKRSHVGSITLEVNFWDQSSVEKVIEYINKLIGHLPITSKKSKVRLSKGTIELEEHEPLEDLMEAALIKNKTQEQLIKFLREQGFRFIDATVITELVPELQDKLKLKPKHKDFQFMVRIVKEAVDPRKDRYDYRLVFGIKVLGAKIEKVVVYLFGKFKTKVNIPWKKTTYNLFKKVDKIMVFPEHMDYEERKKWRIEHKRLEVKPHLTPSKFYTKNARFVMINGTKGDEHYDMMIKPAEAPIEAINNKN